MIHKLVSGVMKKLIVCQVMVGIALIALFIGQEFWARVFLVAVFGYILTSLYAYRNIGEQIKDVN